MAISLSVMIDEKGSGNYDLQFYEEEHNINRASVLCSECALT